MRIAQRAKFNHVQLFSMSKKSIIFSFFYKYAYQFPRQPWLYFLESARNSESGGSSFYK